MAATLEVAPEERYPLAFVLAVEIGHLLHGTKEHQNIGRGLREVYTSLMDAPDGPVTLEFANDELYQTGIRMYADSSELEQWWLDNRASLHAIQERALFPDDNFARAIERFFPEAIQQPDDWDFETVRMPFQALGRRIDAVLREAAPAARALYNKERGEINRRTLEMQRDRGARRGRRYPTRAGVEIWRPAVRTSDLSAGDMTDVSVEGRQVLVANTGDGYFAIDAVCTHVPALSMLTNLSKGELDVERGCVSCPWHGARFDLRTGHVVRPPYSSEFKREHLVSGRIAGVLDPKKTASDTRVYPTKIVGNEVMINIA